MPSSGTAHNVPVLLCFADCVPVVLVAPGGFAVVHSGWKGTIARISAKACQAALRCCRLRCEQRFRLYRPPYLG